jgi:long-subunit acyl-CoA synthetase (AMP-forming)
VSPANPAASALELEQQLRLAGSVALFTCVPLLQTAIKAAKAKEIPNDRIFILPMHGDDHSHGFITVHELLEEGKTFLEIKPLNWSKGQGERQVAYLCFSSGTSGLPVRSN